MEIYFTIVGIVNYINHDELNDFYSSAPGKDVIIKLEPGNVYDPHAVEVLLDGRKIGYVRKADISEYGLFTMLLKEKRHTYNAKVVRENDDYNSLEAVLEYDGELTPEPDMQELHRKWKYSALVLKPVKEWVELENVMDSIMTLLDHGTANAVNLQPLMDKYLGLVHYGFSKAFFDDRRHLLHVLEKHQDEGVRAYANAMKEISAKVHSNEAHQNAYGQIIRQLKKVIVKEYAKDALSYSLNEVLKEMSRFPSNLFEASK